MRYTRYERRKYFKDNLRKMIMHENDLTNHRITWLYAIQGILFLAMGTILNGLFTFKPSDNANPANPIGNPILGKSEYVIFGIILYGIILCFIGISVAYSSQKGLLGSTNAIKRLMSFAYEPNKRNKCRQYPEDFREPVIGGCSYDQEIDPKRLIPFIPCIDQEIAPNGFIHFFPWIIMLPKVFIFAWSTIALYFIYILVNSHFLSSQLKIIFMFILSIVIIYFIYILLHAHE